MLYRRLTLGDQLKRDKITDYSCSTAYNHAPNNIQFKKVINLLETIQDRHEKILICRLNLIANGLDTHQDLQYLLDKVKDKYKSDFYGYIWTCETKPSIGKHYHLAIFLNGNHYKSHWAAMNTVGGWWTLRTGSYYWISKFDKSKGNKNCLGILKRGDIEKFNAVTYGLSYLCKTSQKPDTTQRMFNLSHIKKIKDKEHYRKAA